ncbi:ferritin family protein [Rhizobium sp. FY34]|uniref:ferritin-like domain-containing protein n=1 Tax=Rhizobium sp. FY34 TaxID=2562309 RepID=UPI0010C1301C|nr:ferritin family protein [Rhizobium sp. FY34]
MKWILPMLLACATALVPAVAPAATLDIKAEQALLRALEDEYNAEAFYDAAITKFDAARPFVNIIKAERKHAAMLVGLMQDYGLEVPPNDKLGSAAIKAQVPATLKEACLMGVEAEIANRDLYTKELMPAAAGHADILRIFDSLQAASENNHLPAFQRCAHRN